MALKTIETKAVISAADQTGNTFAAIAQKMKAMETAATRVNTRVGATGHNLQQSMQHRAVAVSKSAAIGAATVVAAERAAHKASEMVKKTVETYREYDDLVRYQRPIMGINKEQQKPLIDQAIHMGATTKYNDLQVLEAQLSLAQQGVKNEFIIPITKFAADFGQAMKTDLPTAAKALESTIFSTGQNMETAAEALKNGQRMTDVMVKTAKLGGFDAEGIQMLFKFGGAAGHVAGLSVETMGAMGALMKKGGIGGDEAGVAIRSISGSLVAPTKQGLMALNALGLDYNKYTRMPVGDRSGNLELATKRSLGKSLSVSQKARIGALMEDSDMIANREEFTASTTGIIGESFGKGKNGKIKAQDRKAIANVVGQFYKSMIESVDSESLLRDIIAAKPSAAQANTLFTKSQGGRFQTMAQFGLGRFDEVRNEIGHVAPGFAAGIGKERMDGFAGAMSRLEGSGKNFESALGRANDVWVTPLVDATTGLVNKMVEGGDAAMRLATGVGGAAAAILTFEAALKTGAIVQTMAGNTAGAASLAGLGGGALGRLGMIGRLGIAGASVWGFSTGMDMIVENLKGKDPWGAGPSNGSQGIVGLKSKLTSLEGGPMGGGMEAASLRAEIKRRENEAALSGMGRVGGGLGSFGFGSAGQKAQEKQDLAVSFSPVEVKAKFEVAPSSTLIQMVETMKEVTAQAKAITPLSKGPSGIGSIGSGDFGNQQP